jgi:hypothetical protein
MFSKHRRYLLLINLLLFAPFADDLVAYTFHATTAMIIPTGTAAIIAIPLLGLHENGGGGHSRFLLFSGLE